MPYGGLFQNFSGITAEEYIGPITWAANSTVNAPYNGGIIVDSLFWAAIKLVWEGRITISGGPATSEYGDSPFTLIDNITMQGYHNLRKQQETFISQIRGIDLWNYLAHWTSTPAPTTTYPASFNGATNLGINQNPGLSTANGSHDVRFELIIPFMPPNLKSSQAIHFLLDSYNYQQLTMKIVTGGGSSLFNLGAAAVAFTAYGSGAGSPVIHMSKIVANAGPTGRPDFVPGRMFMTNVEQTSTDLASAQSQYPLITIPRGFLIGDILLKQGVKAAVANSNVYSSAYPTNFGGTDNLANINLKLGGNSFLRQYRSFAQMEAYGMGASQLGPWLPGYGLIPFTEQKNIRTALNTSQWTSGAINNQLQILADVVGAAGQAVNAIICDYRAVPVQLLGQVTPASSQATTAPGT